MKTIVTVDKADQPFGFPQANEQGYLTSSKVSGPFGNDSVISASYALTASFALNGGGSGTVDTSSLVTTASFNAFTASINTFTASYNTGSFSGSFRGVFSGSFSGSLFGTASRAESASWSPSQTLQQVTTAGSSSTNPINLLNSDSTFASVKLYNYAYVGGNSGRGVGEFLTLGDSASVKIEPPIISFKSSTGGNNALSFPGAGSQYNYLPDNSGTLVLSVNGNTADSAGNVSLTISPSTASIDQINVGEPGDLFVRAGELEQSKHSTLNIFNFLNFT